MGTIYGIFWEGLRREAAVAGRRTATDSAARNRSASSSVHFVEMQGTAGDAAGDTPAPQLQANPYEERVSDDGYFRGEPNEGPEYTVSGLSDAEPTRRVVQRLARHSYKCLAAYVHGSMN